MKTKATWDIEIYQNYLLIGFKNTETKKMITFEVKGAYSSLTSTQIDQIIYIFTSREVFGFNSNSFDMPILLLTLSGASVSTVKLLANEIITQKLHQYQSLRIINKKIPEHFDHFDLKEVAIGVQVSLKLYGGRLGSNKLQDLPYDPDLLLTDDQMDNIKFYCENDLDTNIDLYNAIKPAIDLRKDMTKTYGIDLRSKSDAQIAETLIKLELEKIKGGRIHKPSDVGDVFRYKAPKYIAFKTKELQELFEAIKQQEFSLTETGTVELPNLLKKAKIKLRNSEYKLGIGGLHSTEKNQSVVVSDNQLICDRDVISYYPSMMINNRWYPEQLGVEFLTLYTNIYNERVQAKRTMQMIENEMEKRRKLKCQ